MTASEQAAARARLGLDQGLVVQYVQWFLHALHGDFGISLKYKMPALQVIAPLLGNTLLLGLIAYILVFVFATLLAVFCALHEEDLLIA